MVTDGSFDRKRAPLISGAGWEITCHKAKTFLKGSFFEVSNSAGTYSVELLGLVALHTLIYAIAKYYKLEKAQGKICCDNISALYKSKDRRKSIKNGAKQADLLRTLRTLKLNTLFCCTYEHIDSHMDRVKLWRYLTLEQQMNVNCDHLAKAAVSRSMEGPALPDNGRQLLPLERAAIFIDNCT